MRVVTDSSMHQQQLENSANEILFPKIHFLLLTFSVKHTEQINLWPSDLSLDKKLHTLFTHQWKISDSQNGDSLLMKKHEISVD